VIDIQGITIAKVDDKVRLQSVEIWFDPMEMFRQIAPAGVVSKVPVALTPGQDISSQLHCDHEDKDEIAPASLTKPAGDAISPGACPFMRKE
jgi:hypothetical protein